MKKNEKSVKEQINLEKKRIVNLGKGKHINFNSNKEIKYTKKFPDNKSAFYYPLKKNFMSDEEEKKYNHYYGEEFIDRVSRIDRTNKKETYLQDDIISNFIFLYLVTHKSNEKELIAKIKSTFKTKSCSRQTIINRIKILYDRYHGYLDEGKSEKEFWYMSCKMHERKNILTLFQNNKQLYCNIDNIYDCSFHSNIDPNFDNPSSYDQIKYLKSYKKLIEFSLYNLFANDSNNNFVNNQENNDMVIEEQSYNDINMNLNEEKKEINSKISNNNNIINNNNNNNDLISNASSKILSYSNSKETDEVVNEIIVENLDGTTKTINLNKKKDLENLNLINDSFKNHITDSAYEFNHILKNIRCQNNMVPQIKKIKGIEKEDKKPCSGFCYKNFLLCDEKLHDDTYSALKEKQFPEIYELLLIKFLLILKFDPCHIYKLIKVFTKDVPNFEINCTDIYLHLLSKKFSLRKIIKKELFDLNLKERELSKKNKASLTPAQSKKIEENNLKNMNLNYVPCIHFGNEICDDKCLCSKRGFCEVFCRCNKILCKSAFHGCHCFKGDCTSNHCPCFINGRECNPQRCKNCNIQKFEEIRCKNLKLQMDFESKLIVGISPIAGWGLFANEFIKKDSLIGEYKGELITDEIVNKRDKFREYENCTYMFKLDDEYTIDSRKMGNMLRYANHSKVNSNSYTKIVFSEGQRKIVLIAKRDIYNGEEILFDYDGQGILGKQFSWINDEKKIQKIDINNLNREKSVNNKNSNMKKDAINKKIHRSAIKSINTVINIEEDNESENIINNDKNEIIINDDLNINIPKEDITDINNLNNDESKINDNNNEKKIDSTKKENTNIANKTKVNKSLSEKPPISFDFKIKEKKNEIIVPKLDNSINIPNNNIIDLLSKANDNDKQKTNNIKNSISNPKIIFKTEDDDIMNIRNRDKGNKETNIFNLMSKIGQDLDKKNILLNKKRIIPKSPIENKIEPDSNFKINYLNKDSENKNNKNNNPLFFNNEKNSQLNFEITNFNNNINNLNNNNIINNVNNDNNSKLRKPIFVGENIEESNNKAENNNYYFNNKIRYNFITCQNLNIIDNSKNIQENEVNNIINPANFFKQNNNNNNFLFDKKQKLNINLNSNSEQKESNKNKSTKYSYLGTIRLILELENNPILNDFKFYGVTYTEILLNIKSVKCKSHNLTNFPIDVDFEKDIYGYLINDNNNKGFRIFNDYLNFYDNRSYYCFIPEINYDMYIISNGPLYNKIKDKIDFKASKFKKLLFLIKKKQ